MVMMQRAVRLTAIALPLIALPPIASPLMGVPYVAVAAGGLLLLASAGAVAAREAMGFIDACNAACSCSFGTERASGAAVHREAVQRRRQTPGPVLDTRLWLS